MKSRIFMNELVVAVDLSLDELDKVETFNPDALKIIDAETKCEKFAVVTSDQLCGINQFGAIFCLENEGKAVVKVPVCGETLEEKKTFAAEMYGAALKMLAVVETAAKTALTKINQDIAETKAAIEVVEI